MDNPVRSPRADDLELLSGVAAATWLLWQFDYSGVALGLLLVGLGGYLVALLEG